MLGGGYEKEYLRIREVAEIFGVHYATVYNAVRQNKMPARKIGGVWLIPAEYIEEIKYKKEGDK